MKLCRMCRTEINDGDVFCPKCGTRLEVTAENVQSTAINSVAENKEATELLPSKTIRNIFRHPLFLATVICLTVWSALSVYYSMTVSSEIDEADLDEGVFYTIVAAGMDFSEDDFNYDEYDSYEDYKESIEAQKETIKLIAGVVKILYIILLILPVVIAVGLWITYASARNQYDIIMKTGGLSCTQIVLSVYLVICFLMALVSIFVFIDNPSWLFKVEAVLIIAFVTFWNLRRAIETILYCTENEIALFDISIFGAIGSFVLGGLNLLLIDSDVVKAFDVVFDSDMTLLLLCYSAAMVMFGVTVFVYRDKMRSLKLLIEAKEREAKQQDRS